MNLLKLLCTVSSITMLSRILGFIRDTIIAKTFGAGMVTDVFFVAFKLPNLLRRIFAEGAFYQVFLPILSEYQYTESKEEIRIFVSRVFGLLILILIIVILMGLLTAPWIISVIAPGFNSSEEKLCITITIFRIMLPYILLISLSALMSAILNIWDFFIVPAFTPIFLNISMIGFMLALDYLWYCSPVIGLAWSVIVGGLLQCIYYLPFLKRINMLVVPKIKFYDHKICRICKSMVPALIAVSSGQISLIISTVFASFLQDGSISWMYYADRLIELPVGVFGVALITILSPYLSYAISSKNNEEYLYLMNWGIKLSCIFSLPSAIILGIFSEPLIITLFKYGKFSEFDVLMTQYSVIAYSIGLPGLMLAKVLTSGFYVRHDVYTPTRVVVVSMIFIQFINLICIGFLKHVVFSLSISLGAWLHAGLLYWQLMKKHSFTLQIGGRLFYVQLIIALFLMYMVCLGLSMLISDWSQGGIVYRILRMMMILVASGVSYCTILWCIRIRLRDFMCLNRKNNTVAPLNK